MRLEICIRNQKTRKHIRTLTVEGRVEDVESDLDRLRNPVLRDVFERLVESRRKKEVLRQTADSDFFDAKGNDVSKMQFFATEIYYARYGG